MRKHKLNSSYAVVFAAVTAGLPKLVTAGVSYNTVASTPVQQGQTNGVNNLAETISFEGQGSLNKVIATAAFSYLNLTGSAATSSITLNNGPGSTPVTYSDTSTASSAFLNLASQNFGKADIGVNSPSTAQQTQSALRLEWHWDGTVDGSNDLINDQIGYNQSTGPVSPLAGANRGPSTANPIYVNTNSFTGGTGNPVNGVSTINGFNLNNGTGLAVYNTYSAANYNQAGNNLIGGTNRVQFAFTDVKTMDYSFPGTPSVYATPGSAGYGNGNPAIPVASGGNILGIGVTSAREAYQAGTIANMPTSNFDPGTVSTANPTGNLYSAGPWNSAGLGNLSSTPIAANAVLIAANPGTGLSRLNKSDAQWIQTTGRLANGLEFNTVSRDADLGQRPSFATATGIDGTWAVGVNDGGNTTTSTAATLQHSIGSMKFSGKSSDTEVYNTIANSRMGAGVLALTSTISAAAGGPVRSLDIDFSDLTDPQLSGGGTDDSQFISANLNTISNYQYQAVLLGYATTAKSPNAAALLTQEHADGYLTGDNNAADATNASLIPFTTQVTEWNKMSSFNPANPTDPTATGIKGDTTGDVAQFLDNVLNSQGTYQSLTTTNDPADAFLNNSYLLPNLLANIRDPSTGAITPNPNYNSAAFQDAQAIYANKFNADYLGSYGKDTETIGLGSNYGSALTGGGSSPANFNGNIPINARDANGNLVTTDAVLEPGGNWLFGNFNQNGVRDLSAVESGLAAAKALWSAEPAGTTGANSAFNVSSGIANANNSTPVTYTDVNGNSHTLTKGDLIVLGDFLSVGRFDGASLVALAQGAAASDAPGTAGYTAGTISDGQANFADAVRSATLRKNDALVYLQTNTADATYSGSTPTNASAFLRESGHAVLTEAGVTTAAGVPRNAVALNSTDPNSGLELFTYDQLGSNSFNSDDVNRDGVIDFNDAVLVDQFNGQSYSNLNQQLAATELAPVTGAVQSIDLANVQQIDGEAAIGSADLAIINTGLTGSGSTNWYGYQLTKTGPGTIIWARTGGVVTVYPGASLQISSGSVHVISAVDPFTDSLATAVDTTKSLSITVTSGGLLEYTGASTSRIQLDRLSNLNISSGGQVTVDQAANHAIRTLLIAGGLSIAAGGQLDLGNSDLDVQNGNLANVTGLVAQGFHSGSWNGNGGIASAAAAADSTHLTALGGIQNSINGLGTGSPLYGSGTSLGLFDGTSPAATDVLVKYTYYGDTNLDGVVDGTDYSRIDSGYLSKASGWFNGDFNYDGVIDGSDYTLIDNAYNSQGAVLSAETAGLAAQPTDGIAGSSSAVPEPTAVCPLLAGMIGLLGRRRRGSAFSNRACNAEI